MTIENQETSTLFSKEMFGPILPDVEKIYNEKKKTKCDSWKDNSRVTIYLLRDKLDEEHREWRETFGSYDYESEYSELIDLILAGMMLATRIREKIKPKENQ